ncbi:helix-turn-helix domain-containing protein [Streptococcus mutans]|nr:helix-turn-helix transcriptional regulator [Streptococcus mutans]MCB4930672.1 helix-turn-helix domain-containing protein [Streptococcus mutans]MCB5006340.1 helix-turn-helix domain-containing protein [Streptococcus mutans]MCB5015840.1 helix-turn-helix domain-containing protein [Streptococcus mutans]MCB5028528.1 helix-turn-helix domain-containing protein [Streptococcus mutans]MCB5037145.1 helix-turn-helix domain-containing protein [Streptococcus mutans]
MTQLELAEKMRVTDKAVSKWERDLSFPDINSIPKLAEIFEVSVDDLMQVKTNTKETIGKNK